MSFFQDIASKFGLLGDLAKQTVNTVESQITDNNLKARVQALPKKETPTGGFFTDLMPRAQEALPRFVTPQSTPIEAGAELGQEVRKKIAEPIVSSLPMGIGDRLMATPEQVDQIKAKYKDYNFSDVGKDAANSALDFTVNPLLRIGMTGQEIGTGKSVGTGPGVGFKDAKTFPPSQIGSYQSLYKESVAAGDNPAAAGLKTGIVAAFDIMLGLGMSQRGLPAVKSAARELPESLLYKIKNENITVDELTSAFIGNKPTPKGNALINQLSNPERVSLYRLLRAYEDAGIKVVQTTEKVPTELGKFAESKSIAGIPEIRPTKVLPGYVGEGGPRVGLQLEPVEPVGFGKKKEENPAFPESPGPIIKDADGNVLSLQAGKFKTTNRVSNQGVTGGRRMQFFGDLMPKAAEVPPEIAKEPLAVEASKYKSAEEFVKAQEVFYHGTTKENAQAIERDGFKRGSSEISPLSKISEPVFLTKNKTNAQAFAGKDGVVLEVYTDKGATKIGPDKIDFEASDPSKLKTKSQLTDIWNKAHKEEVPESEYGIYDKIVQPLEKDSKGNFKVGQKLIFGGKEYTIDSFDKPNKKGEVKYSLIDNRGEVMGTNFSGIEAVIRHPKGSMDAVIKEQNRIWKLKRESKPTLPQKEVVKAAVAKGPKSIKEIAEETKILEPNVRRIVGVGTKEGTFDRVAEDVYVLKDSAGKDTAYIKVADSIESLPKLAAEGFKADKAIETTSKQESQLLDKKASLPAKQIHSFVESKQSPSKVEKEVFALKDSITQPIKNEKDAKNALIVFNNDGVKSLKTAVDPISLRDISVFTGQFRDVFRNFEHVYGDKMPIIKRELLDPFDAAKGRMSDIQMKLTDELYEKIVKGLGIKKGSKMSEAVMDYGEKHKTLEEITKEFGEDKASKIVEADKWFQEKYNKLLDEVNSIRAEIYPYNPEKQIPKRENYYRHYRELGTEAEQLKAVMETPSGISPSLSGVSPFTKPKSKFLSFAQRRIGIESERDAVGGFLNYVPAYSYAKEIDPFIGKFRGLAKTLAEATENTKGLNNFIEFLQDFSNDLAGKTNPADRYAQKIFGRKAFMVVNWLNRRIKSNVILGNLSSSVSQIFNVPQAIGFVKQYSIPGAIKSFGGLIKENPEMAKSSFIKERYINSMYEKFEHGMIKDTKKMAAWIVGVLDEVGTKFAWNSAYLKGVGEKVANPIKYADDYARKFVAGRGVGEVPLGQKSKLFQIVAPFQLEVGNAWWVLKDFISEKQFGSAFLMLLAGYLMNQVAKQIKGNDVVFDPIQAGIDGYESFQVEDNKWIGLEKAAGRMAGEVFSNVPGGQTIAAALPDKTPDWMGGLTKKELFGAGDPTRYGGGVLVSKGLADPVFLLLPSFGGGQLKKTYEGTKALIEGGADSASGKTKLFKVAPTMENIIKMPLFGKYAASEAREAFNPSIEERKLDALNKKETLAQAAVKDDAEAKFEELKSASKEEKVKLFANLEKNNKPLLKKIAAIADKEARGLTRMDRKVLSLGATDGFRAKYIASQYKELGKEKGNAMIADYIKKKIITKEIAVQLSLLLSNKLSK